MANIKVMTVEQAKKKQAKEAKARAAWGVKVADIEAKRKAAGLPPLVFGRNAENKVVAGSNRTGALIQKKAAQAKDRLLDMALWESNKKKAKAAKHG